MIPIKFRILTIIALSCTIISHNLHALTLSEKRTSLAESEEPSSKESQEALRTINEELTSKHALLKKECLEASAAVSALITQNAPASQIEALSQEQIKKIKQIRSQISLLEAEWKEVAETEESQEIESLWHQPDTTIGQLVMDYGSTNFVYVLPPEIANLKIHISSQLSVPKALWNEMLELILAGYGIGIKELNPFLRQVFFIRLNNSGLLSITDSKEELELLPEDAKVAFLFTPEPTDVRRIAQFLDKFAPQEQVSIQQMGGSILLIGSVRELSELLKIATFITAPKMSNTWRLITLQKASAEEMAKMLSALLETDSTRFDGSQGGQGNKMGIPSFGQESLPGFKVVLLKQPAQSLFLVGNKTQIDKAVKIIEEVEASIGDVQEKSIYWYACRHSEAEELAKVLSQVYIRLIGLTAPSGSARQSQPPTIRVMEQKTKSSQDQQPGTIVQAPPLITPTPFEKSKSPSLNDNFIVDPKTNSIVMVVENYVLPKLKELVRKLDVPKQMVQIDVLLFEKRVGNNSSFGMNLLRMGSSASGKHKDSINWNNARRGKEARQERHKKHKKDDNDDNKESSARLLPEIGKGILEYAISRGKKGTYLPFDLVFQFLLTQENIQINANPSVTTVNQTPAKIAVVDQISINTGAVEYDLNHFKDAYTRAEYGITIQITPTVHAKVDDDEHQTDEQKFITLATDIIFDTTRPSSQDRPSVTRRNVKNEVRVADGETVIIGGLRRKTQTGDQESVPFLGELPGIGKLFSTTALTSDSTEMFVFITPRIVPDAQEEMRRLRRQDLLKRPGDTPEFLREVEAARLKERGFLFERSLDMLFKTPGDIQ